MSAALACGKANRAAKARGSTGNNFINFLLRVASIFYLLLNAKSTHQYMSDRYRQLHLSINIIVHTIASMSIRIQERRAVLMQANVARMLIGMVIPRSI